MQSTSRPTSVRASWRRSSVFVGSAAVAALVGAATVAPAGAATADPAEIYIVHAVAGPNADISVDGEVVKADAAPKTIVGPLELAPGSHEITFAAAGGAPVTASVELAAGASVDVVAHQGADPTSGVVLTEFPNDLSAVAPGKARLVVAHTATVPPADIRVNGDVLFSNVANGEALTLVVPGGTYNVDIVPAATDGPVVFGPVPLTVVAGELNRVYAFGNPTEQSMDAIVRTAALPVQGSGEPGSVDTGTGGQAASLVDRSMPTRGLVTLAVLALVATILVEARRRRTAA